MEKTKEIEACPNCGYKFKDDICIISINSTRFSIVEKPKFRDGDVCMCFNCGKVHQHKNGILELSDIRDLPKEIQEAILKTNVTRQLLA